MSPHQVVAEYWAQHAQKYAFAAETMANGPALIVPDGPAAETVLHWVKMYATYAAHDAGIVLRERERAAGEVD